MKRTNEDCTFTFWVPGKPIPQGSMKSYGNRSMVASNKDDLEPWRKQVNKEALNTVLERNIKIPLNQPIQVRAYFYFERPKSTRKDAEMDVKPDLDKLQRAIGDALSPKYGKKILFDDSRITKWDPDKKYAEHRGQGAKITVTTGKLQTLTEKENEELKKTIAQLKARCQELERKS